MLDPGCYLSFCQEPMGLIMNWVGIETERVIKNARCVVKSVKVLVMCCGSVWDRVVVELTFC